MFNINNNHFIYMFNDFVKLRPFIPKVTVFNEKDSYQTNLREKFGFPRLHSTKLLTRKRKRDDFYISRPAKTQLLLEVTDGRVSSFEHFCQIIHYSQKLPYWLIQKINNIQIKEKTWLDDYFELFGNIQYDEDF